jgi:hypothetical protein
VDPQLELGRLVHLEHLQATRNYADYSEHKLVHGCELAEASGHAYGWIPLLPCYPNAFKVKSATDNQFLS